MYRRLIAVSGLLLAVGLACSGLTDIAGGGSEEGVSSSGETLFSDNLADETSGWEIGDYSGGRVGYWNGAYYETSLGDGQTMWEVANRGFDDIEVARP